MALFGLHTPIFGPLHAIIGKLNAGTGLEGFTQNYLAFGNSVGGLTEDINLQEIYQPRDWIQPEDVTFTTFYEILKVEYK